MLLTLVSLKLSKRHVSSLISMCLFFQLDVVQVCVSLKSWTISIKKKKNSSNLEPAIKAATQEAGVCFNWSGVSLSRSHTHALPSMLN